MEALVIQVAVVIIVAILINAFIQIQEPFKSVVNVVLLAALIIILLRGTAHAASCSTEIYCDHIKCYSVPVCR